MGRLDAPLDQQGEALDLVATLKHHLPQFSPELQWEFVMLGTVGMVSATRPIHVSTAHVAKYKYIRMYI